MRARHAQPLYALRAGHPPNGLTAVWGVARPQGGRLKISNSYFHLLNFSRKSTHFRTKCDKVYKQLNNNIGGNLLEQFLTQALHETQIIMIIIIYA